MKLLRTIRFDASDRHVFANAAEPGEWAVSGVSLFADVAPGSIEGKLRQAFANGFLGAASLGHSTFVTVATADDGVDAVVIDALARQFVERLGAPDLASARTVAEAEVHEALELCRDLPPGTVLAVSRDFDAHGTLRETFRRIPQPAGLAHDVAMWTGTESDD